MRWTLVFSALLPFVSGCQQSSDQPDLVWGQRGVKDGELVRPRAIALDAQQRLFIVDFTARIQVFDREGKYLHHTWTTPDYRNGRPSGLSIDRDGNLMVSDSHYNCVRTYDSQGNQLRVFGTPGTEPGTLGYVSDVVQDQAGFYYVAEFGEVQRISKFDAHEKFLKCWGSAGSGRGQFARARALALGPDDLLYVADACNHRIQVFTKDGKWVRQWGKPGAASGEMRYPYDLCFGPEGNLHVVEYGNHRVQKFDRQGRSLATWGSPGRGPGQLHSPWALVVDQEGYVHVVDSENHRVQRFHF